MALELNFLAGVIEGFYGQPWSQAERLELFDRMSGWGLNTYFYAPKDDLKHRAIWREPYSESELNILGALIQGCRQHKIHFIYGLSPGLDIRYGKDADLELVRKKFEQMLALGCRDFSLLFDDLPERMIPGDGNQQGSLASAQCDVANAVFQWIRGKVGDARLLFCPTPYCGRMVARKHGGADYLSTVGKTLLPEIGVLWTGPEIVSPEISVAHVEDIQALLRRKPIIWDNLHANDYDGRRFFCGPYSGRPRELRNAVGGILCNPNNEFPLNYVPLRTFSEFIDGREVWDARKTYLSAIREWLPCFATIGPPINVEDLVLLGDCYYLPHEEGPEAEALYRQAQALVTAGPGDRNREVAAFTKSATRLRDLCGRMTELQDRALFYALGRRVWELREELDLLLDYVSSKFDPAHSNARPGSDSQLPGVFRGGMAAKLQRLLIQTPDGTFTAL